MANSYKKTKDLLAKTDFKKRIYSTLEISLLINKTQSSLYNIFKIYNIEPVDVGLCVITNKPAKLYSIDVIKSKFDLCNKLVLLKVPRNEKKPYFEFSEIILESKMNLYNY